MLRACLMEALLRLREVSRDLRACRRILPLRRISLPLKVLLLLSEALGEMARVLRACLIKLSFLSISVPHGTRQLLFQRVGPRPLCIEILGANRPLGRLLFHLNRRAAQIFGRGIKLLAQPPHLRSQVLSRRKRLLLCTCLVAQGFHQPRQFNFRVNETLLCQGLLSLKLLLSQCRSRSLLLEFVRVARKLRVELLPLLRQCDVLVSEPV
mmetsp:Transcript_34430/g.81553  ORF Transcript_34430/g.81553 Transcript_34430/m.81553 type:complete len:210 (-) Transcript_34430:996-1625(-)